jgi:hypothetical protein
MNTLPAIDMETIDLVNSPPHYTTGKIEVCDFIVDQKLGFCLGNVVKYVARADRKGNAIQDLEKAAWYLNREIHERKAANGQHE